MKNFADKKASVQRADALIGKRFFDRRYNQYYKILSREKYFFAAQYEIRGIVQNEVNEVFYYIQQSQHIATDPAKDAEIAQSLETEILYAKTKLHRMIMVNQIRTNETLSDYQKFQRLLNSGYSGTTARYYVATGYSSSQIREQDDKIHKLRHRLTFF